MQNDNVYILVVEQGDLGEHPINIYLRKVNIDPKGYPIGEYHGKSLVAGLNEVKQIILKQEGY